MHTRVEGLRNASLRRQRLREVRKDETLAEGRMERGYFRQRVSANTGGGSKAGLGECWSFHVAPGAKMGYVHERRMCLSSGIHPGPLRQHHCAVSGPASVAR